MKKLLTFCACFWNQLQTLTKAVVTLFMLCLVSLPITLFTLKPGEQFMSCYMTTVAALACYVFLAFVTVLIVGLLVACINDVRLAIKSAAKRVRNSCHGELYESVMTVLVENDEIDIMSYVKKNWDKLIKSRMKHITLDSGKRLCIVLQSDYWSINVLDALGNSDYYFNQNGKFTNRM